jgi:alpha-galactosidase
LQIEHLSGKKIWILNTKNSSYAFGLDNENMLRHIYWGKKLPFADDYVPPRINRVVSSHENINDIIGQEYPVYGGISYVEPCLKATFSDNVRDICPEYKSHSIKEDSVRSELIVELKDSYYDLIIRLHYAVIEDFDIVERHCEITNSGKTGISIESALSAAWNFPGDHGYRMTYLAGKWAGETQLKRTGLTQGKKVIESRRGYSSHHSNPWFAIDRGDAAEDNGDVWFGALNWSGNWKITAEETPHGLVSVAGGINDFDFEWMLEPGETFVTPVFSGGYSDSGFGKASRLMHGYQMEHVIPKESAALPRKVLYNSWEATYFDLSEKGQGELAEKAASIGAEMFVVDDGWFGKRNGDNAGLGDWNVNREKFPEGLAGLIKKVNGLGMDFGIWVEPEMVNPDSDLYRAHPDWVLNYPNRRRTEARNQLVLNLAKKEVRDYILHFMDDLLSGNNIKFVKWDFNRPISEAGWPEMPAQKQREIWVRFVRGLYEIIDILRKTHPGVLFESCAGGGGRVDLGILRRTDQVWTSDNTDAFDRLSIQEGFSYAYCPKIMMSWVTDSPNWVNGRNVSLKFRFHSAMTGSLGIGGNLNHWTEEEMKSAGELVSLYKKIRHIVQEGSQYRLASINEGNFASVQYVTKDRTESVAFFFLHYRRFGDPVPCIKLKGLDPDRSYRLDSDNSVRSGQSLMSVGLYTGLKNDFDSAVVRLVSG